MSDSAAHWAALERELDAWASAGRKATVWWRDDDAERPGPALDRLLALAEDAGGVPLALAVVPAGAGAALAARLARAATSVQVLQHGWAHVDHEGAPRQKCELGPARSHDAVMADLRRGTRRLAEAFDAAPVLVPPWNRVRDDLLGDLAGMGIVGLSRFGPRAAPTAAPGLSQTNTHVDIIDWRSHRGFAGTRAVLHALVSHLLDRRAGTADAAEPTGILSHHRVHDEQCWSFLAELLRRTRNHPAVQWTAPWHPARRGL